MISHCLAQLLTDLNTAPVYMPSHHSRRKLLKGLGLQGGDLRLGVLTLTNMPSTRNRTRSLQLTAKAAASGGMTRKAGVGRNKRLKHIKNAHCKEILEANTETGTALFCMKSVNVTQLYHRKDVHG